MERHANERPELPRRLQRDTNRHPSTIRAYAQGYATWSDGGRTITLNEAMERVKMGAETEAVTEAIAAARNLSISRTRQDRGTLRHAITVSPAGAEK